MKRKAPVPAPLKRLVREARAASHQMAFASTAAKDEALRALSRLLMSQQSSILRENQKDLRAAEKKKTKPALLDRLRLTPDRLAEMAQGVLEVAGLADPVGKVIDQWVRPNGLEISRVRIPIGVFVMIYEARPNVTIEAASLAIKSGNATILRGGREAFFSNRILARLVGDALTTANLPRHAVQTLTKPDRSWIYHLLKMDSEIDLVIPRGGESLIRDVTERSTIPVLKHFKGVCHVFVDASADIDMAQRIILNAKVQRPGVCNALETLLVHRSIAPTLLPPLLSKLSEQNVEIRGTPDIRKFSSKIKRALPSDFGTEFLDLILAIDIVDSIEDALDHIRRYGSNHTEAIVTRDSGNAERFLRECTSSTVLVNASTRFADGGQLGLGAEIGISTTRLHAYGPMGLEELTIPHFIVRGSGQVRGTTG